MVVSELRGEKIDIIPWNNEPARFVAKALSPARVREVYLDDDGKEATVVVPDDQLALAIGKEGHERARGWYSTSVHARSQPVQTQQLDLADPARHSVDGSGKKPRKS